MSLLAPIFLLGLLALVVPWWLHLISTDDPPSQAFGSSMFLEQQQTVSSKQSRLRYWLLLLLRTLAVALIALLFAEPVLEKLSLTGNNATRHIIAVDTSLSQSHRGRWANTQALATEIIDTLPAGDQIMVVGTGANITIDDNDDFSAAAATALLASLSADAYRLDYSRMTGAINGLVKDSPLPVQVHIISDMQRSAMPDRFSDLAITGIEKLHLRSTASVDDENVSVTAVVNESADNQTDLSVLVQNHSAQPVARQVEVSSAAGVLDSKSIQLGPDARTIIPFEALGTRDANGRLTIELSPADDLPRDDVYTIAIPDGDRSEVTVLGGIRNSLATTYVTAALESDPRYRARLLTGDTLPVADAGPMVIVPDASTLTDRAGTDLREYLDNGGSALVIAGNQPHSATLRNLLKITAQTAASTAPTRITTTDNTQPLVRDVASDWRALSLQQLLMISTDATDRVILSADNNTPLLIERNIGNGRLLVFASALDPLWNSLALEPLFVPFIIRSVEYLRGESASSRSLALGDAIALSPGAQLINSDGETLRELAELNRRSSFTFTEPGVYTVRTAAGNRYLSVNSDPLESDLDSMEPAQIERWQNLGVTASNTEDSNTTPAIEAANRQSLWFWVLLSLLAIAMIESLYSHRHLWVKRGA